MQFAVDRVRETTKVAEVCICYTGDVANPNSVAMAICGTDLT